MSKNTKSKNTVKKVEEPVYDQKFLTIWEKFWTESENVNHDIFLLKFLKVEYPSDYEVVKKILHTKTTDWKKDVAIRHHFRTNNMIPAMKVKKATNGKRAK